MNISYKTRKGLLRFGVTLGILSVVALVIYGGWVIWAGRYVIYTRDGAKLDLSMDVQLPTGTPANEPLPGETVEILHKEPVTEDKGELPTVEATPISGYYIDPEDLIDNIPTVLEQLKELPAGTAVMLDMKNIQGHYYYATSVGSKVSKDIDMEQMNTLLEYLLTNQFHVIARIPAFRDREYGLNNVPHGLAKKGGNGSLWMDDKNCYWLDPTNDGALGYLVRVIMELKGMGFDEVVFTEFRFPDTDKIVFEGDKETALKDAAQQLVDACGTNRFFVSFYTEELTFPLPGGNSRMYLEGIPAAELPNVVSQATVTDPKIQLLFITEGGDTRYNDYCVLRPLNSAH